MIKLTNVTKSYGRERVLNNVNAFFRDGEIHGIIGRNGPGKTVLLKCIAGLTTPDRGTIRVGRRVIGRDIETPPRLGAIIETPLSAELFRLSQPEISRRHPRPHRRSGHL